jgi:threonine synthase
MPDANAFICTTCGKSYPVDAHEWLCSCGGLFDLEERPAFAPTLIDQTQTGLWRYGRLFGLDPKWSPVGLGEGGTPLLRVKWEGLPVHFKLESLNPTGSFKDRGAATLVTALAGQGAPRVVADSSGNVGSSLAAYTARAGVACEVCVPNTVAGPKLRQMEAYGAEVIEIRGRREYAALAAWAAAAHGATYASHVYNPFFIAGIETLAFELWEQLGKRPPGAILLPVGNGTLLLGVFEGFRRLHQAGAVRRLPRLIAVQAEVCAPVFAAFHAGQKGSKEPGELTPSASSSIGGQHTVCTSTGLADSIAIARPRREEQIVRAVRESGGAVVTVTEKEIGLTHQHLASQGFDVEPTAAAAVAALARAPQELMEAGPIVIPLTGHGLKARARG